MRLNPRKADLRIWRERFAQRLQERGVQAVATRAATRGVVRASDTLWRVKAAEKGQLRKPRRPDRGPGGDAATQSALVAWQGPASTLRQSPDDADQALARDVASYLQERFKAPQMKREAGRSVDGPGQER